MSERDYEVEFRKLEEAMRAGKTDGEGPADVVPVRDIPVRTDEEQHDTDSD